jgi:cell division protease FtsH
MHFMEESSMNTPSKPDKHSKKPPQPDFRKNMLIWFIILLVMMLFYVPRFLYSPKAFDLPYSEFKQQVESGNVSEITIQGEEIRGTFENEYVASEESQKEKYSSFVTVLPSFADPELIQFLEEHDVTIKAKKQSRSWLSSVLIFLLPWLLIIGFFVYSQRKMSGMMGGPGGIFGIGRSRAKRYEKTSSKASYEDVAGLENAKKDMQEVVDYLKEPDKFTELGANIPKGILLVGPPGTGKTLLARATAGEADVPFFSISGSEFIEMFVGVGASRVRDMFATAKKEAPTIIFIDEIDSIGRARGTGLGGGHDEREQTLNQILSEMDGFAPHESVIVLAATNRPDVLDAALTRPGRFDRQITLDLPQKQARRKILQIHTRHVPLHESVDLENIAARTVGFSGAELQNLVNEAALLAGRNQKKAVSAEEFDEARDKILLGAEREEAMDDEEKKLVAYHEAGHALMAKLIPEADPLQKVTIIPRGRSLGATEQTPEEDRHNFTRQYLLDRIAISMGGRAAEQIVFGDLSNGAAADLKHVTKLARKMVTQWGMSEKVGPVTYSLGEDHPFLGRELSHSKDFSEATARIIDEEIQTIITGMEERAVSTLKENQDTLKKLAEALLEHETLENEEIEQILDIR